MRLTAPADIFAVRCLTWLSAARPPGRDPGDGRCCRRRQGQRHAALRPARSCPGSCRRPDGVPPGDRRRQFGGWRRVLSPRPASRLGPARPPRAAPPPTASPAAGRGRDARSGQRATGPVASSTATRCGSAPTVRTAVRGLADQSPAIHSWPLLTMQQDMTLGSWPPPQRRRRPQVPGRWLARLRERAAAGNQHARRTLACWLD
jgi:hypothetical protein